MDAVSKVFSLITFLRHAPQPPADGVEGQSLLMRASSPAPLGGDTKEASRRRERGAKALEERLLAGKAAGGGGDAEKGEAGAGAGAGLEGKQPAKEGE